MGAVPTASVPQSKRGTELVEQASLLFSSSTSFILCPCIRNLINQKKCNAQPIIAVERHTRIIIILYFTHLNNC